MNYQDLQSDENEILSVEDENVRRLCGSLKRVDAPKDFDFRLKSRIAARRTQNSKSPAFAFLRFAAPLALVLVILGVVVSNSLYSVDNPAVASLAGSFTEAAATKNDLPVQSETPADFIVRNNGPNANSEADTARTENSNLSPTLSFSTKEKTDFNRVFGSRKDNRAVENNNGGGSRDSASTQTRVIIPQEFNTNRPVQISNTSANTKTFSVKEVLDVLGIEATNAGNGWMVQTVRPASLADRSGIKPNDFINAIDNKMPGETMQTNSISGKTLTVVRDGVKLEIVLK